MAKRFTDTGKWKKESFGNLPPRMKLVWIYLCDNCDHAGIWDVNMRLLEFQVGERVTLEEITEIFGEKVILLSKTKLFIPSFVEFQYGILNAENRAHKSVIDKLTKEGAYKGLTRSLQGRKDKEKDKDKEKKGESEGKTAVEEIYRRYPRKRGKSPGIKKLLTDIKNGAAPEEINTALSNFITSLKRDRTEPEFVPYFSTWVSQWRDWLDPEHGKSEGFNSPKGPLRIQDILAAEGNGGAA